MSRNLYSPRLSDDVVRALYREGLRRRKPMAQLMDGQIAALRHWANGRAREATGRATPAPSNSRRMAEAN